MAIKINGTTVIDNARELANIASLDATTIATLLASLGGLMGNVDTYTASANFTVPSGVTIVSVIVIGGGGGGPKYNGGNDNSPVASDPGSSGGVSYSNFTVTPASVFAVVVGSGGNGATTNNSNGGSGGSSSFSSLTAGGGGGTRGGSSSGSSNLNIDTTEILQCVGFLTSTAEAKDTVFTAASKSDLRTNSNASASVPYSAGTEWKPGVGGVSGLYTTTNDGSVQNNTSGTGAVGGAVFIFY